MILPIDGSSIKQNSKVIDIEELVGMDCIGSFDSSEVERYASAVLKFDLENGETFILSHAWVTKKYLDREKMFPTNCDNLTIVEESYVHKERIVDWFVTKSKLYNIVKINYEMVIDVITERKFKKHNFNLNEVVFFKKELSEATKTLEKLLFNEKLVYNNSDLYNYCLSNVNNSGLTHCVSDTLTTLV